MDNLQELINEYRACIDAAEAAKALILDHMERHGVRKACASYTSESGATLTTTATYKAASADSLTFDAAAFKADPARAALYDQFATKPRKGAAATVSFSRKTA